MLESFVNLNQTQLEAVTATEGHIRVIAGAGSGKTRALTHRFAFLVNEVGILPGNILCVTFTNKAADEMRHRIHLLTGDNDTGYICTFHSFCVSVLQEDSFAVQYPKSFLVLDNSDIDDMLRIIYAERGLTLRDMTFRAARDMIEIQKLFKKPDYYLDMITMSLDTLHEKYLQATETKEIIFYGYLYQEKKCFGLDYNDLIKFVLYIFSQNHDIKLKWQKRLEYIMIDEFQDIDLLQYELMENLCGYHNNLFIVGDPDQTIYTWRGANVKYLLDFDKNFPNVRTIMMNENYRSTPQIINAVNSLIGKNRYRVKKDLIPMLPDGESVLYHHAATSEDEAKWIVSQMLELNDGGVPFRDMTVLYRAHYITRTIEDVLRKAKIPSLVKKLRETCAFVGFSRLDPYKNTSLDDKKSMIRLGNGNWLPAVENYGEGIFFEFSLDAITEWSQRPAVQKRIEILNKSYKAAKFSNNTTEDLRSDYVLLHTFAHIIINQLSYECGYGSSSLKERIYCERCSHDFDMCGVLIYTASGDSEGSLGGLVRRGEKGRLEDTIISATRNASWCSSDPICIQSVGQGPESCNLAACHNCALLPETCCEVGNRLLDRALIVGDLENKELGFFSELIRGGR